MAKNQHKPENCSWMPKVPYHYEVNWHLVTGNGSLSKRSLSPSLIVQWKRVNQKLGIFFLNDRFETWSQKNQTIDLWLEIDLKN